MMKSKKKLTFNRANVKRNRLDKKKKTQINHMFWADATEPVRTAAVFGSYISYIDTHRVDAGLLKRRLLSTEAGVSVSMRA